VGTGKITAEIEHFIRDNIHSIEHLEVLLLLAEAPGQEWSVQAVCQKLYRQPESVAARLEEFRARRLLLSGQGSTPTYRFNNATHDADLIRDLDRAYKQRKDSVIELIFATPRDNLRVFSDAFRLRRDDKGRKD
jgi:hypothetical protein